MYCHFVEDTQGYKMELRFLRDADKREVDFVVLKDKTPYQQKEYFPLPLFAGNYRCPKVQRVINKYSRIVEVYYVGTHENAPY